jgi:hypothetical protein
MVILLRIAKYTWSEDNSLSAAFMARSRCGPILACYLGEARPVPGRRNIAIFADGTQVYVNK